MSSLDPGTMQRVLQDLPPGLLPLSRGMDHLGVAVESVEASLPLYRDLLGMELLYEETVESEGIRAAVLQMGETHLELLEPLSQDSPIGRFLQKKGPGIHHLALKVTDCSAALKVCTEAGLKVLDPTPRPGAGGKQIGFLHPRSTGGILLELCQGN